MDVHKLSIAIAVLDVYGKLVMRTVIETSTEAVRDFFRNLRGEIHLTFEEGNHAAWLYDIVEPLVRRVVACNPKHNRIEGSRSDRVDAVKLAELAEGRQRYTARRAGESMFPFCWSSIEMKSP